MKVSVTWKNHRVEHLTMPTPQLGIVNGQRELDSVLLVEEDFFLNERGGFSYVRQSKTRDQIEQPGKMFETLDLPGVGKQGVPSVAAKEFEVISREQLADIISIKADGEVVWTSKDLDTIAPPMPIPQPQKEKLHSRDLVAFMTSPAALESVSQSMGLSSKSLPISR